MNVDGRFGRARGRAGGVFSGVWASGVPPTISDVDGAYFIIGVPVGEYDVQASFVGYQTETVTGVDVSSGYTQEINFSLSPGVELDEIVVTDTIPLNEEAKACDKIRQLSVAEMLAETMRRISNDESVSSLYVD